MKIEFKKAGVTLYIPEEKIESFERTIYPNGIVGEDGEKEELEPTIEIFVDDSWQEAMNVKELTELRKAVKQITNTYHDDGVEICYEEDDESPIYIGFNIYFVEGQEEINITTGLEITEVVDSK